MANDIFPDISVIVCCYNHEQWIERCIRSLCHQVNIEKEDYEIVVINDGSEDNTHRILKNIDFISNMRIIENDENIGLPKSLNKAIQLARGRYIVRVDSDDYVARMFLYLTRLFLDMNKQYQAVATDYIMVNRFEKIISRENCFKNEIACGIMFRKECLFDIGLYDDLFQMREGHDLKKRFMKKFNIARLEFPVYKYRQHKNNRTKNVNELSKYNQKLAKQEK